MVFSCTFSCFYTLSVLTKILVPNSIKMATIAEEILLRYSNNPRKLHLRLSDDFNML